MAADRNQYLAHLEGDEERLLGARLLDLAEAALQKGQPQASDFLDPHQRQIATGVLGALSDVDYRAYGGYPKAERQRLLVYPAYYLTELLESPLRAVELQGEFGYVEVTHRDFLGACLATGLKRERIGDLILVPGGCQIVLTPEALPVVLSQLDAVHRVPVQVTEIDIEQLMVEPERVKEMRTTVASLRLDAVAAFGFGMSRTKMAREIKGERLKVNWKPVDDPAHSVAEGDVLSMRGRGRVTIVQITGQTRKGRIALALQRTF
jgi:photosystem II S4 domain protein